MSAVPWVENILAYSLQIAVLVVIGALLPWILRLRHPRVLLTYWQILLVAVLVLPLVQPLQRVEIVLPDVTESVTSSAVTVSMEASEEESTAGFPFSEVLLMVLIAGILVRATWLTVGFLRLRALRRRSRPLVPLPAPVCLVRQKLQIFPRFRISPHVPGPVTFGVLDPIVLFPADFEDLDDGSQEALACHEMLHIRRRDWLYTVAEEFIRTFFWFHPALWWLIEQIQAAREQAVDREVLEWTASRPAYLDALLQVAQTRIRSTGIPAPLFLRERQLARRVALMLEEVSMSKKRIILSVLCMVVIVTAGGFLAVRAFPLTGAPVLSEGSPAVSAESASGQQLGSPEPQITELTRTGAAEPEGEPIRVGGNVQATKLIHRVNAIYPEEAKQLRVQGIVMLEAHINEAGEVWALRPHRGHPLLVPAAIDAVQQWRYSETTLQGDSIPVIATVTLNFLLRSEDNVASTDGPGLILHMDQSGIIWEGRQRLEGADLVDRVQRANRPMNLYVHPLAPQALIDDTVQFLQRASDLPVRVTRGFTVVGEER